MMTDDGVWYDERIVSIPTGDAMKDAVYNMNRAAEQYTLPQRFTLNGETAPSTTRTTGAALMISDEAVEAANKAMLGRYLNKANIQLMLEAAAPHMLREAQELAWAKGATSAGMNLMALQVAGINPNPYRSQP